MLRENKQFETMRWLLLFQSNFLILIWFTSYLLVFKLAILRKIYTKPEFFDKAIKIKLQA